MVSLLRSGLKMTALNRPHNHFVDKFILSGTNVDNLVMEEIEEAYRFMLLAEAHSSPIPPIKKLVSFTAGEGFSSKYSGTKLFSKENLTHASLSGGCSKAFLCGDGHVLSVCGRSNALFVIGKEGCISSSGEYDSIYYSGDHARISSSGNSAKIHVRGNLSHVSLSGEGAKLSVTGRSARVSASGGASITVTGDYGVILCNGGGNRVTYNGTGGSIVMAAPHGYFKGSEGTYVSAVTDCDEKGKSPIITGRIGENDLKPNTFYAVLGGKFVGGY